MADLQQTIMGALQQAGLRDPQMLAEITASVMAGLAPSPLPGFGQATGQPAPMAAAGQGMGRQLVPGFSGPAPSELYGYEGQPNRDLLASQSYGRGPAPAGIDPREPAQMLSEIDAEQGWSPFAPQMMPPGSPAMGPGVTASPPSGGGLLASDALRLRKPAAPSSSKRTQTAAKLSKAQQSSAKRGLLSDSDRLNWQSYLASGGDPSRVPPQIRSLLSSGA